MSGRHETQIACFDSKQRKLQRECLWNLFCKEYSKRDMRVKAYSNVAEISEKPVEAGYRHNHKVGCNQLFSNCPLF